MGVDLSMEYKKVLIRERFFLKLMFNYMNLN